MNWNPSDQDCVIATKDAVTCEFGNGLALLDLKSNVYYSLNGVGAYIWQQIQTPTPISDVHSAVLARYNVDPERCKADVEALLKGLVDSGLARVHHEELV
jgi:hypothetical protein